MKRIPMKSELEEKIFSWTQEDPANRKPLEIPKLSGREIQGLIEELVLNKVKLGELDRVQKKLQQSEDMYLELLNFCPDGLVSLDENGTICEANAAAAETLGTDREALVKQNIRRFISSDSLDVFEKYFVSLVQTGAKQNCDILLKSSNEKMQLTRVTGFAKMVPDRNSCYCRLVFSKSVGNSLELERRPESDSDMSAIQDITERYLATRITKAMNGLTSNSYRQK
jgi:PAS domain-containing protein